jgi:hypothetical protein
MYFLRTTTLLFENRAQEDALEHGRDLGGAQGHKDAVLGQGSPQSRGLGAHGSDKHDENVHPFVLVQQSLEVPLGDVVLLNVGVGKEDDKVLFEGDKVSI